MGDFNPWHLLEILMGLLMSVISWLGLNQIGRINALEKEKASISHVAAEIAHVGQQIKDMNELMREARHAANNRDQAITARLDAMLMKMKI